jgi:peptidoglycan/xylan/chitin deacetylase (PgdA/CDA1 family)
VQQRVASGLNDRLRMSITFDDGYAANNEYAIPMLVEQEIPCTYFVTVDPVLKGTPFEHDVANGRGLAPNTVADLRCYSANGVEIGAHTRTHADLGKITCPTRLRDEVLQSRDELQDAIGQQVQYFAFPFGGIANLSVSSFQLARTAGFAGACSAYGGYNVPGGDAFHLKRRCLDGTLLRIKNWVTIDPFRNRRVCDFECKAGEMNDGRDHLISTIPEPEVTTRHSHGY